VHHFSGGGGSGGGSGLTHVDNIYLAVVNIAAAGQTDDSLAGLPPKCRD